jgi:hypothetical protein
MKRSWEGVVLAAALCAAAACGDKEHYPPGEGGGGGGGGGGDPIDADVPDAGPPDAAPPDAALQDASTVLSGRLCRVSDLRQPLACAGAAPSGVDVVEVDSGASGTTDADGTFDLNVLLRGNLVLRTGAASAAARDGLVSLDHWQGGDLRVPSIAQADWDDLLAAFGGAESDGTGSIVVYVRDGDGPAPGVTVNQPDGAGTAPFYDGANALDWAQGTDTGASGAALLLQVPAGTAVVSVAVASGDPPEIIVPVEAGALTWAMLTIP